MPDIVHVNYALGRICPMWHTGRLASRPYKNDETQIGLIISGDIIHHTYDAAQEMIVPHNATF